MFPKRVSNWWGKQLWEEEAKSDSCNWDGVGVRFPPSSLLKQPHSLLPHIGILSPEV